jgi:hypothetical protein
LDLQELLNGVDSNRQPWLGHTGRLR